VIVVKKTDFVYFGFLFTKITSGDVIVLTLEIGNYPVPEPPPGPSQCNYPRCGSDRTVHLKKDKKKDH